jgi:hypothetical protein
MNPKKPKKCKLCKSDILKPLNINQLGAARFCSLSCLFLFQNPKKDTPKAVKSGTSKKSKEHFTVTTPIVEIELTKAESKEIFDRDAKYLSFIRKQPCLVNKGCNGPIHAHHSETGGASIKASDYSCIPLCSNHHTGLTECVHKMSREDFESFHHVDINKAVTNNLINYLRSLKNV